MKKITFLAFALGILATTSCNSKKENKQEAAPATEIAATVDSAFQKSVAGDYKSLDGSRVITLNSDLTAATKNFDKEYYKWELAGKSQDSTAVVLLIRKGIDADVQEQAVVDLAAGKLVIKNETFRRGN